MGEPLDSEAPPLGLIGKLLGSLAALLGPSEAFQGSPLEGAPMNYPVVHGTSPSPTI